MEREVKLGEIVAYRAWRPSFMGFGLWRYGPYVTSTYVHRAWSRGPIMTGNPDDPGYGGALMGVHAYKTEELLQQKFITDYGNQVLILGSVLLWGRVTEHSLGYRAEFARIKSIDSVHNLHGWRGRGLLRRVRKYYRLQEE